jgi:hypothetical protein
VNDPYHALGLRRNPFYAPQSLLIDDQHWIDVGYSWAPEPGRCLFVQILGAKGAGKTSHLLRWQAQTGGPYFYQAAWHWQTLPPCRPEGDSLIAYWDEANRIPWPTLIWALSQAKKHSLSLAVASHSNLAPWARALGWAVQTVILQPLNLARLEVWSSKQLAAECLMPQISPRLNLTTELLENILQQSQGSWRTAATLLHRWTAQQAQLEQSFRALDRR